MRKRVTWVETLKGGPEIEFYFEPIDGTIKQAKCGDRYVVGYLAQDYDPLNPMQEYDGQGTLYTYKEGVITDSPSAASHLGLSEFGGRFGEPEYDLALEAVEVGVAMKVQSAILSDDEFKVWAVELRLELGEKYLDYVVGQYRTGYTYGTQWSERDDAMFDKLKEKLGDPIELAEKVWEEQYAAGKIGDKFAVPVRYYDMGSSGTRIDIASLDTCNAVWVPDQCALDNLGPDATYEDAEKYAKGVLDEYENWCNGYVYGVCIEVFDEDGEQVSEDSCWGHIGWEYAEEALDEEFESACRREVENYERDVKTQCGKQQEMTL